MKRFLVLLLCLLMLAGSAVAEIPGTYNPPPVNEGQYPVEGDVKLTYWSEIRGVTVPYISSYDENYAYQNGQDVTGVDLEFIHPASGTEQESFSLMLASGDLPDMIIMNAESWYNGGLQQMYEDGIIVDITPYLEDYAPQYLEVLNADERTMIQIAKGEDQKVLGFYRLSYGGPLPWIRCILRADWLEEFGMKEPTTIEEYEAYFEAILANKPGVTPLHVSYWNMFMGAFDMLKEWYDEGGQVNYYAAGKEYKEFLQLMNKWYQKGYLSKDFMSMTETEVLAAFDSGTLAMYTNSVDAVYTRNKDNPNISVTNAPYMRKAIDSKVHSDIADWPVSNGLECVTVITTACENVEAAVAYLNYPYTFEGSLAYNYGPEGLGWTMGEDGNPVYTDFVYNNPDGWTTAVYAYIGKAHLSSKYTFGDDVAGPALRGDPAALETRTKWKNDPNVDNALQLPPLTLTTEENARRSEIMTDVDAYADEMMLKFIVGTESLDDYDTYLEKIEAMGLAEAREITQTAYDRFYAK